MQPLFLTVLEARGKRLTKIDTADGRKISYDRAKEFRVHSLETNGFDDMVHHIAALEHVPGCCLIRGTPLPWCPTDGTARRLLRDRPGYANQNGRLFSIEEVERNGWQKRIDVNLFPVSILPTFEDGPSYLVPFDFDGIEHEHDWREHLEETADWLKLRLPAEFADASCFYQATSSAADPTKPDLGGPFVRMRLFFWLSRPLTGAQLKAWIPEEPGLDKAIFGAVQPIYVAGPLSPGAPTRCASGAASCAGCRTLRTSRTICRHLRPARRHAVLCGPWGATAAYSSATPSRRLWQRSRVPVVRSVPVCAGLPALYLARRSRERRCRRPHPAAGRRGPAPPQPERGQGLQPALHGPGDHGAAAPGHPGGRLHRQDHS